MKALIHLWAGSGEAQLSLLGYTPNQEIDPTQVFQIASLIFDVGLNVMISHGSDYIILWVDTKRFQQR